MQKTEISYPYTFKGDSFRCVGDRIIIRKKTCATKELAVKGSAEMEVWALEHPWQGEVVAVGDGVVSGIPGSNPPQVTVGDTIYYEDRSKNSREWPLFMLDVGNGMETFIVLHESNIIMVKKSTSLKK